MVTRTLSTSCPTTAECYQDAAHFLFKQDILWDPRRISDAVYISQEGEPTLGVVPRFIAYPPPMDGFSAHAFSSQFWIFANVSAQLAVNGFASDRGCSSYSMRFCMGQEIGFNLRVFSQVSKIQQYQDS